MWRLQRCCSRWGSSASGFDWDVGDAGWLWQEKTDLGVEAKLGRVVLSPYLSSLVPASSPQWQKVLSHQALRAFPMPGALQRHSPGGVPTRRRVGLRGKSLPGKQPKPLVTP